jgi:hypothetical protein
MTKPARQVMKLSTVSTTCPCGQAWITQIPHDGPIKDVNVSLECPACHQFGRFPIVVIETRDKAAPRRKP